MSLHRISLDLRFGSRNSRVLRWLARTLDGRIHAIRDAGTGERIGDRLEWNRWLVSLDAHNITGIDDPDHYCVTARSEYGESISEGCDGRTHFLNWIRKHCGERPISPDDYVRWVDQVC